MFSVHGATAITLMLGFNCAIACIEAITLAAPHMSHFIASMPAAGLTRDPSPCRT